MTTTFQGYVEKYLRDEGLYEFIASHRRKSVFKLPTSWFWLIGFILVGPVVMFVTGRSGSIVVSLVYAIAVLLTWLLIFIAYAIVYALKHRGGMAGFGYTDLFGYLTVLGPALTYMVVLGIWISLWPEPILFLVGYIALVGVLVVIDSQAYRVHLVLELFASFARAIWRSISLVVLLIPLLLVLVLLSVFTQDFWQVVGAMSISRMLVGILWISIPTLIFVVLMARREVNTWINQLPGWTDAIENAKRVSSLKSKTASGYISIEEWQHLADDISWRESVVAKALIGRQIAPRLMRWMFLTVGLTCTTLFGAFFLYFFALFVVFLPDQLISQWTGIGHSIVLSVPLAYRGYQWVFQISSTWCAVSQVSAVLASMVTAISGVYSLSDESMKSTVLAWLREKSFDWYSVCALYQSFVTPGYQEFEYQVNDAKAGKAHVLIVVPTNATEEMARVACEHMENRLDTYRHLVIVTAFPMRSDRQEYRYDLPGMRWQLLHNKVNNIRHFSPMGLEADEPQYQHFLGQQARLAGDTIPSEWFGDTEISQRAGRTMWEWEIDREWILHPHVRLAGTSVTVTIQFEKRMPSSGQYKAFVHKVSSLALLAFPDADMMMIDVCYRDTTESLAHLLWNEGFPTADYKDELLGRTSHDASDHWR